ncbi:MAG: M23 family metallopeptidase [Deltaproteobacteria bacterium]|nr:M23 family metallopeptidase [Deltaproteobacteria bacterium]MBW2345405.1 M23 family metallopeptidase [Deltaproteobacteria bacterium]
MDRKKTGLFLTIVPLIIILGLLAWLLSIIFEGQKPLVQVTPLPQFLSESREFTLNINDDKRGLKHLLVSVNQGGRETIVLEKKFPFKGLFNREGSHKFDTKFSMNPLKLNLAQGRVDLKVRVWDYSRRSGGDGNLSQVSHKMVVDTVPPSIRAISRLNYVNLGGTGLIVYQTSSDTVKSGLYVNDLFFPGFPAGVESREGFRVCYFAVPCDIKANPDVYLWAEDRAGNLSRGSFHYNIRTKRFRTKRINITDRFLKSVLPYFSFYHFDPGDNDITKFLKINRDLRKENNLAFSSLRTKTNPERLWKGDWIRLRNAANMAGFGDRRSYYHNGAKIDQQVHMGVDLASLENAKVRAANNGLVIFSDRMGIYGLTVVLDHGQGLASVYSHLSSINVKPDRKVTIGDVIGLTGHTGLAGGDHLHFGIMVSGVFVNPIEWWDSHWIQDNITRKLTLVNK